MQRSYHVVLHRGSGQPVLDLGTEPTLAEAQQRARGDLAAQQGTAAAEWIEVPPDLWVLPATSGQYLITVKPAEE